MKTEVFESSVQRASLSDSSRKNFVMRFSQYDPILPEWGSPERDKFFRKFWKEESTLSSSIYSIVGRNAAFGWELYGSKEDVIVAQELLQFADFGNGWQKLIEKTTIDYLTTDNGAFWEIIRPARVVIDDVEYDVITEGFHGYDEDMYYLKGNKAIKFDAKEYDLFDSPLDPAIGIAHLDSGRVTRTGNKDIPYVYRDRNGYEHKLRWWQVIDFVDMPSPEEDMLGIGFCAISRAFRIAHTIQSMTVYKDEKLSGKFNRAIHITNADPDLLNDQIADANRYSDNMGLLRYSQPIVASTFDPTSTPQVATIDLASIPDGFTEESSMNWYIAILALALGVDYSFLAPLPGKGLGTASQSETMARQARGKSSRLFMDMITTAMNFRGILPSSVQFQFVERDTQEETEKENAKQARAKTRQLMIANGEINPQIARQMANDSGDLSSKYLEAMGEEDMLPGITAQGDISVEAVDEAMSKKSKSARKRILSVKEDRVQQRKQQLLHKKPLAESDEDEESKAYSEKQEWIDRYENEELRQVLDVYGSDFEQLLSDASVIDQSEFEERLSELIALTLLATFSIFSELAREDYTEDIYLYLEESLGWNLDSIETATRQAYSDDGMTNATIALWLGSMASVAFGAMLRNPNRQEEKLMWELGEAEHCTTCLALEGQVHSVKDWMDSGFQPRCTICGLECGGFRCQCQFVEVPSSYPDRGSFASVPRK